MFRLSLVGYVFRRMGRRRVILSIALAASSITLSGAGQVSVAGPIDPLFPEEPSPAGEPPDDPPLKQRHWALLIGISDYSGGWRDLLGGKRDALQVKAHLRDLGWREDHIEVLTNANATKPAIMAALDRLASKAATGSTVVFSYSGHGMLTRSDADGDAEPADAAIVTHEGRRILDGTLARKLDRVDSPAMWIHIATCRAGGFADPGVVGAGRVVTLSSRQGELSYEDPQVDYSVMGRFTVVEGMRQRQADRDGDRVIAVEEAFRYADPRVQIRTSDRQHPLIIDRVRGALSLRPGNPVI